MNSKIFYISWAIGFLTVILILMIYNLLIGEKKSKENFAKLGKSFYDDELSIHEPIIFYISNMGVIVFLTTFMNYIIKNHEIISTEHPSFGPTILFIGLFFFHLLLTYVVLITYARLAATLAERKMSNLLIFVTIFVTLTMIILLVFLSTLL